MARAIDWPSDVLPTPGGPTKHRIGALPCGASLRTARYSTMRRFILSSPKWSSSRMRRASAMSIGFSSGSAQGSSIEPVEIGANHARLRRRFRHALVAAQFLARRCFDLWRHLRLGDRRVEFGDLRPLAVALAELPLDRRHLLAQDHFALAFIERHLVCRPISCVSRSTSIRLASKRETLSIRATTSIVSRISCFLSGSMSR